MADERVCIYIVDEYPLRERRGAGFSGRSAAPYRRLGPAAHAALDSLSEV